MTKKILAGVLVVGLSLWGIALKADLEFDAKVFAKQLHDKGYQDSSAEINAMQHQFSQKPENQSLSSQIDELSRTFEGNFDSGKKDDDKLKSYFGQKTRDAAQNKQPNQPGLGETEEYAKQKHRFEIAQDDALFKKHQKISESDIDIKGGVFQKGNPSQPSNTAVSDKIITCRQGVAPQYHTCTKRLKIRTIPQPPIVKTVTAYFTAQCYNLVSFNLDLKTGSIGVYQCENKGSVNVAIDNPIGEPDYPDKTTIRLLSQQNIGEGGVKFTTKHMNPSAQNNFTASFTAFQPKTGGKKKHNDNKNRVRGAKYVWEVTIPQKPKLEKVWEGCEDLERKEIEQSCELVEQEQFELNQTRTLPEFPPITEPYWSETKGFLCGGGRDINECESLIQQKCEQVDSKCVAFKNNVCVEYENTFRCLVPDYQKGDGLGFQNGELNFLSGQGAPLQSGYSADDFVEAVTGFSALTEMGKEMQEGLGGIFGDPNNPSIFRGKSYQCRVNLGSFVRDCCKLKGILQGLIGKCNEEEKQLAVAAVKNKRCVKVDGRYCHKKVAKVCVEKRDSYCCYGSQLARILQEIAHHQLGLSWGDAEHPICSSLTAEQLSKLNFDEPCAQAKLAGILSEVQGSVQDKFNRTQKAVSALKNLQIKTKEWEQSQKQGGQK